MEQKPVSESRFVMSKIMQPHESNSLGNIHGGVVMRVIDEAAAVVATRHARHPAVTASVDQLSFFNPVHIGNLLTLRASLNHVGKSSMEIGVRAETENLITGEIRHVVSAYLTFVALSQEGRPIPVPGLILETDEDCRRNLEAGQRRDARLKLRKKKE